MILSQLKDCGDEPITIPGSIQSHGLLLVINTESFIIEQLSENSLALLGYPASFLLNTDARDLVTPELKGVFQNLVREAAANYVTPFEVALTKIDGSRLCCHGISYTIQNHITFIELEPLNLAEKGMDSLENYFQLVQNSVHLSNACSEVTEVANLMAEKVKQFTGFDRVMVYRFSKDGSGEVIAEKKEEEMEPYLNRHYPASDIPPQARELYLRNWVRLLRDVNAQVSPLSPVNHPRLDAPTPLDKSVLRSISPIHHQYLRNMGVQSTLTISLTVNNRLWGLIACHHRTPRFVSYGIRATSSLYGMVMSSQLQNAESTKQLLEKSVSLRAVANLLSRLDPNDEFKANFSKILPTLLDIFQADGAALVSRDQPLTLGSSPPIGVLKQITAHLEQKGIDRVTIVEELSRELPEYSTLLSQTAGMIAFALSHDSWLIIFRDEYQNKIHWGGDPNALVENGHSGQIGPQESFKQWTEEVKGRCKPWPSHVGLLVDRLRSGFTGFVIAQNRILETNNEELQRFAIVVAHEVKSQLQPPLLALSLLSEQTSDENLATMLEIGINSLTTLSGFTSEMLSFAQLDSHEPDVTEVDFADVARRATEQATAALADFQFNTVFHSLPKRYASLSQSHHLFLNLIRNAIIHGPMEGQEDFQIEIGFSEIEPGVECFFVRDNGRGIPKEDQEYIFEYFRQGNSGKKHMGSGIGLGFVRRLLSRNGGHIWVESEFGKGSTFYFTFNAREDAFVSGSVFDKL